MAETNSFLKSASKALDMAIPLLMRKQQMDTAKAAAAQAQANSDRTFAMEATKVKNKMVADRIKLRLEPLIEMMGKSIEGGNQQMFNQLVPQIEGLTGAQFPTQTTQREGSSLRTTTPMMPTPKAKTMFDLLQADPDKALKLLTMQQGVKAEQWGEPYTDNMGNLLKKNLKTGEVSRIAAPPSGMDITTPEGLTIRTGVGRTGAGGMGKKLTGDIEEKLFSAKEAVQRHTKILEGFRPEYFEIPKRVGMEWGALKDKLGPIKTWLGMKDVDPETRKQIDEYSTYRKGSLRMINEEIKRLTGAQMSEKEAKRLRGGMPDFGEGLIPPDSAQEFYGATVGIVKEMNLAAARYQMYLAQGILPKQIKKMVTSDTAVPLDQMKQIIEQKENELLEYYTKQKGLTVDRALFQVKQDLSGMFGLGR